LDISWCHLMVLQDREPAIVDRKEIRPHRVTLSVSNAFRPVHTN
jgi:hypothetical protein